MGHALKTQQSLVQNVWLAPDMVLADAYEIMMQARQEQVFVLDGSDLCGVLYELDLIRHVSQHGGWATTVVASVMRRP
ncbi:MAG: CBS domain-containing protein [Paracoccaceae bacterium]